MKSAARVLTLALVAALSSLLTACQTTSVSAAIRAELAPAFTDVATVKQANPDVLGGLFGRESISTLALAGALGSNQAAFAAIQIQGTAGL